MRSSDGGLDEVLAKARPGLAGLARSESGHDLGARADRFAGRIGRLCGWRRYLLAVIAGASGSLAFAPYNAWPILFVSFGILVWLLDGDYLDHETSKEQMRAAGWTGFAFGVGFFLSGFYWIATAFLVEPWRDGWLIPFALAGFSAWMAIYFTGATIGAMALWHRGASRVFALAFAFGLAEFIRGHLFTGQPWDLIGYGLTGTLPLMQLASIFGVYALSVLAVLVFAAPAAMASPGGPALAGRSTSVPLTLIMLGLLGAGAGWGSWRLDHAKDGDTGLHIRIVQPAVDQADKWKPGNGEAIFSEYLDLSRERHHGRDLSDVNLLVWPETAIPAPLPDEPLALKAIGDMLPKGTSLLVGSIRLDEHVDRAGRLTSTDFYNSLLTIGDNGRILDSYDKMHLVPFGEYLPFEKLMDRLGIMALTGVRGGFTAGSGPRRLTAPGAPPFMPLICYEIVFPDEVNDDMATRPGWMLNVTNDAWFGRSIGPYQHFHQARVRAVEQGLPLVRAANTGISAIVDPYGRIETHLGLFQKGVVDGDLPSAISSTLFVRFERAIEAAVLALGLFGCLLLRRTN